jgi:hypothetical protein
MQEKVRKSAAGLVVVDTARPHWNHQANPSPLNQETLLFEPAQPRAGALRAVLAFPSSYSVGITSLGYQMVWATLAQRPDIDVRRLFTDQGDPAHGGQRGRGPDLDLFGLSLSWELDGPVLLDLLEQQRIPLWSSERGDQHPLVFGGGPVLTANPEPLAPFFDVLLLGDGEELLPAFLDGAVASQGLGRAERLRQLARQQVGERVDDGEKAHRAALAVARLALVSLAARAQSAAAARRWRAAERGQQGAASSGAPGCC